MSLPGRLRRLEEAAGGQQCPACGPGAPRGVVRIYDPPPADPTPAPARCPECGRALPSGAGPTVTIWIPDNHRDTETPA
jgi:hypothetical protein